LIRKASLLIRNGRVYTVDGKKSRAQAVAVVGDRIVFVGTNRQAEEHIGPNTKIIDAEKRTVLPGFIDSHVHFTMGYMETSWVKLDQADSLEDIFELILGHVRKHPEYRLIGGFGWKYETAQSTGGLPNRKDIDEVIPDKPVLLLSFDGWMGLANSKFTDIAMRALRVSPSFLGSMESDPGTGEPTGVIHNPFDFMYIGGHVSELIRENEIGGLKEIISQATRLGITSVHEALADLKDLNILRLLRDEGSLNARVYCALYHPRWTTEDELTKFEEAKAGYNDEWVRTGAIKLFIDGVLESHTAALLEGYADRPSFKGELKFTPKEFNEVVERLDRMGFQCFVHACGDRGVRIALDAFENALRENGRKDGRHRIEHIEVISDLDIPRFKQLGVIASMQPEHVESSPGTAYYRVAGEERMRRAFRWRSLMSAGATLAFSSDWSVADLNPLSGIHEAVTRHGEYGKDQTVPLEKAIEAYTINGAYASFEEHIKGSLEVGKLADIVILSEDLFEIPADRIREVEVLMTVLGGREIYRSDMF